MKNIFWGQKFLLDLQISPIFEKTKNWPNSAVKMNFINFHLTPPKKGLVHRDVILHFFDKIFFQREELVLLDEKYFLAEISVGPSNFPSIWKNEKLTKFYSKNEIDQFSFNIPQKNTWCTEMLCYVFWTKFFFKEKTCRCLMKNNFWRQKFLLDLQISPKFKKTKNWPNSAVKMNFINFHLTPPKKGLVHRDVILHFFDKIFFQREELVLLDEKYFLAEISVGPSNFPSIWKNEKLTKFYSKNEIDQFSFNTAKRGLLHRHVMLRFSDKIFFRQEALLWLYEKNIFWRQKFLLNPQISLTSETPRSDQILQ